MHTAVQQSNDLTMYEEHPNDRLIIQRYFGEAVGRGLIVTELFTNYSNTSKAYQVEIRRGIRTDGVTKYTPTKDTVKIFTEQKDDYAFKYLKNLHVAHMGNIDRRDIQYWSTLVKV